MMVSMTVPVAASTKTTTKTYNISKYYKKATTKTTKSTSKKISYSYTKSYEIETIKKTTTTTKTTYYKRKKTVKKTVKTTTKINKNKRKLKKMSIKSIKDIIPNRVYQKFPKSKCKIIINKNDKSFKTTLKGCCAYYSADKNKIVLTEYSKSDMLHEVGHWVSHWSGDTAYTQEFENIYKAEKNKFRGFNASYVKGSKGEFFAGTFYEYCTNPSGLKKSCPKSYKAIQKAISNLK